MQFYDTENAIKFVQPVTSAAVMISSMTSEIEDYILSKFPKNYFRKIQIDTAEAIQMQKRSDRTNPDLNKNPYPNLSITPEFSLDDPINGMEKGYHLSSPNLYVNKNMRGNYQKVIIDPNMKFSLYNTSTYLTSNYNFKITTNKIIQNINIAQYIKSAFQINFFGFLNGRYLETEIPKTFIKMIADLNGWDLRRKEDVEALRLYLIAVSQNGDDYIHEKRDASTGKECFFINEKQNLLINVTDLDAPASIIRDGQTEGEYMISFRVQTSAWICNAFIMSMDKSKLALIKTIDTDIDDASLLGSMKIGVGDAAAIMRKDHIKFEDSKKNIVVGTNVSQQQFSISRGKSASIDLASMMKDDFLKVHAYAVSKSLDLTNLFAVRIYSKDGDITSSFDIDYEKLTCVTPDYLFNDFIISVFVNRLAFESIQKAAKDDEFFFNNNGLAELYVNIGGTSMKVRVYSFVNSKDAEKTDPTKCLRIMTPYGIGYIGLVDPSDSSASQYRLCVGYLADGTPIIKSLELAK